MKSSKDKPSLPVNFRPERRSDLNFRNIEGETVVLDRRSGLVHQLNPTASVIWSLCDGDSTIKKIAENLVAAYEVESSRAINDVAKAIAEFQELRLLVAGPQKSDP